MKRIIYVFSSLGEEISKKFFVRGIEVQKASALKISDEIHFGCLADHYHGEDIKGAVTDVRNTAGDNQVLVIGVPISTETLRVHLISSGYKEEASCLEKV